LLFRRESPFTEFTPDLPPFSASIAAAMTTFKRGMIRDAYFKIEEPARYSKKGVLMALADMHVHSRYSRDGGEWLLRMTGIRESYTEIAEVYAMAKMRNMNFVTVTDHDAIEGSLELVRRFPGDTFTGVEVTARFPENGCEVHVLVYDLNERQFEIIQSIRHSIYTLRDYIRYENLPHSVAHATFNMHKAFEMETLEKLVLLFDVFEGTNGTRNGRHNRIWNRFLDQLTPGKIEELSERHTIEPFSDTPWIKGFTGGSDDHAGLFIGKTFTAAECTSRKDFLQCLRDKKTLCGGRSSNYRAMAFTFFKIGQDFSNSLTSKKIDPLSSWVRRLILQDCRPGLPEKLAAWGWRFSPNPKQKCLGRMIGNLLRDLDSYQTLNLEEKIDCVYRHLSNYFDELIKIHIKDVEKSLSRGRMMEIIKKTWGLIPSAFMPAPFLMTMRILHQNRNLINKLKARLSPETVPSEKVVLWFTDAMRSPEETARFYEKLQQRAGLGHSHLRIMVSLPESDGQGRLSPGVLNLAPVYSVASEKLKPLILHIPSLLGSLEKIQKLHPDEIIVDTPGPLGLLGLLASRLLDVPCTNGAALGLSNPYLLRDEVLAAVMQRYTKWFVSLLDVPLTSEMVEEPLSHSLRTCLTLDACLVGVGDC
jgi:predicted metal-dependent phosphoesterase TrpH